MIVLLSYVGLAKAYKWEYVLVERNFAEAGKNSAEVTGNDARWTVEYTNGSTNDAKLGNFNQKGQPFGSSKADYFQSVTFSSSSFGGTINSVTIECSCQESQKSTLSVKVGSGNNYTDYTCNGKTTAKLSAGDLSSPSFPYKFSGSSRGQIIFHFDNSSRVFVKSITLDITPEVNIRDIGWTTYATPCPVDFGQSGLQAYAVTLINNSTQAHLEPVSGTMDKLTCLLVKGAEGIHTLTESDATPTAVATDLKITDGTVTTTDQKTIYVLSQKNGVVGFYRLRKGTPIPKGRCYLEVPASSSAKLNVVTFDEASTPTAISLLRDLNEEPADHTADRPRYNLAGQPVGNSYHGIVISQGKKTILR